MKIKTLPQIVKAVKDMDSASSVSVSMLTELILCHQLPADMHGNRRVADFDTVIAVLCQMLGLTGNQKVPRLRSIREALAELRRTQPEFGISEERLRRMIAENRIESIRVGNRAYIAMEVFEDASARRFAENAVPNSIGRSTLEAGVMEQVGALISSQPGMPRVTRIRKSA